ncbi:uncharacterized protein LOC107036171 isoform X2 [Diachasma alloeum]|uniref:uncharacterized protein LOC107036171 isoform X2 n=1 Tax=Diachasma alloeum TaxID=454923 RepID=UPI0007384F7D|nr:uncharacterized protein LOC107036171 isoform X2 [Diachasma alloeum]
MDPENIGKEAILRVAEWVNKIRKMKRRGGPIQQWVDSIATPTKSVDVQIHCDSHDLTPPPTPEHSKDVMYNSNPAMTISAPSSVPCSSTITLTSSLSPGPHNRLMRDPSLQSDSSHCSSVESLLELRRADPEAILLGLGFGGCPKASQDNGPLSRIPKRFLQPSKLKGITIDDFVRQQQETTESIDSASLGYRGLTGSPYVAPSEIVQKIMERLREHESHELDAYTAYNSETCTTSPVQQSGLSVLSPDNRQFLDRQRSKSPDICNKRMIIGKKSFAFSCDGDLIEINNPPSLNTQNYRDHFMNRSLLESINVDSSNEQCRIVPESSTNNNICPWNSSSSNSDPSSDPVIEPNCRCGSLDNESLMDDNNIHGDDSPDIETAIPKYHDNDRDWTTSNLSSDTTIPFSMDSPRRASDSSCAAQSINSYDEGRRFSDGTMRVNPDRSKRKNQSRRILQRQARIRESDAIELPLPDSPDSLSIDKLNNFDGVASEKDHEITDVQTSSIETQNQSVMRPSTRKTFCDPKKHHLCCKSDNEQICIHEENCEECCYYKSTRNCWRKMHKIMKKNEKLENMVAKSRQEMAEIREMLSSVLSVRMEPGF